MLYGTSLDDRPEKKGPKGKADYVAEQGLHAGQSEGGGGGNAGNPNTGEGQFTANSQTLKGGRLFQNQTTNKEERDHFKRYGQTISQAREVQQQREIAENKEKAANVKEIADIAKDQIKDYFDKNPLPREAKSRFVQRILGRDLEPSAPPVSASKQGFGLIDNAYVMRSTYGGIDTPPASAPTSPQEPEDDNPDVWQRIKEGFINRNLANAQCWGVEVPFIAREYTVENTGASSGTFTREVYGRKMIFDNIGMLEKVTVEELLSTEISSGSTSGGL